jgi:PAS domain S-box-containing protein
MALKQTTKIYAFLALAAGCLNLLGQPTSTAPVSAAAARQPIAAADLDAVPVRTIASLIREWSTDPPESNQVVHVRGTVIDQRVGEYLVVRDQTGTILAESSQTLAAKMQSVVDVWGNASGDLHRLTLRHASFRLAASDSADTNEISQKPVNLPLLTHAQQVRELSPVQAGWEYPVKIRGVVTLTYQHTRLYVEDETAGIYIRSRLVRTELKPGDLVEVEGTSNPGWYVPIIVPTKITVVGTAALPKAPEVSLFQMANGQYDSQWVESLAVVRDSHLAGGILQVKLSDRDGTFIAKIPAETAPTNLVDSVVRIHGVCVSQFNNKRQITGVEMWAPSIDSIQITEPAVAEPFNLPAQSITSLSQSRGHSSLQRRTKVTGIVTAFDPGKSFFLQDNDDGIQVFPLEKAAVKIGDRVEVSGYPALGDYGSVVRDAVVRVTGNSALPSPKPLIKESPLDAQLNNLWVEANAQVTGDPETEPNAVVPMQLGNTLFKARILSSASVNELPRRGSIVHLTGVYQVLTDDMRAPRAFQIIVPSEKNLQIINRPSSWTFQHTMLVVGTLVVVACLSLLWVLLLRRKVAEQTVIWQQSEMKFRSLVEQSLVGVYVIQDGRFVYANPRMAEIWGVSIEEFTSSTMSVRQFVLEEDWPIVEKQIKRRLEEEIASAHYTLRARRKDGTIVTVEVLGSFGQYEGKPAILGTAIDITERKVAESKLAEASNLLDTLLDNSPDHIYFKDVKSRFVRASKGFEKLFNLTDLKDLTGKTDFDFFKTEHAQEAFHDEQEIIRTGKPIIGKVEVENHPDGRVTSALTTKMPWRDSNGKIIGTFGISKDVTAVKEAEAKLAYEHDLFHALLENFPDVIYFKDLESRFVRVSRSKVESSLNILRTRFVVEHPNAKPDELPNHLKSVEAFGEWLVGKTDFDTFAEERARDATEDEQKIIKTGEPIIAKVERTPQADGVVTWCISTKIPWRDKNGKIIGTFGVSKDITALKQAEAELDSAHQRLIETSRLAGMAEVATDVLHNVGNVLNSVNVSCSLTIDRVKTAKISSLAKTAALMTENRNRLSEFFAQDPRGAQIPAYLSALAEHFSHEQSALLQELEQLLKHIEHIKQIVAMQQSYAKVAGVIETINPTQLVDDAIHINGAALTRHDVQLRCEFEPVPMIQTEKHRVLQILVNLIRNAKYALDEAKRPDKLLTIKLGKNGGDHIKIQVIDNGVGIPEENLTRIFGHGFTTRRNGHGFGLHSSALAIKELGGSLTAHSDGVGKGATFVLLLPENPPRSEEPQ